MPVPVLVQEKERSSLSAQKVIGKKNVFVALLYNGSCCFGSKFNGFRRGSLLCTFDEQFCGALPAWRNCVPNSAALVGEGSCLPREGA